MKASQTSRPDALPGAQSLDPCEQQARGHLAARRFRKARDDFKALCKKDRAKYLPLLIEANSGLVEEMLDKGLISEAQQVVDYLKTLAPPGVLRGIELLMAVKTGKKNMVASGTLELLAFLSSTLSPAKKIQWADQLVLSFAAIAAASPEEALISSEASSIHAALEAVAAGQFDRALETARPLPRHSLFSHWKQFVKALVSFHAGDAVKAARLFQELPADSAPGLAREPYLLLLGRTEVGRRAWAESSIETAGHLHGQKNWGPVLGRAQSLWLNEHYVDSYKALRNGIPDFPNEGPHLLGVMSDFFFNASFTLNQDARTSYIDFFLEIEGSNRPKNKNELKRIQRLLCLVAKQENDEDVDDVESLEPRWEGFLLEHHRVHGANPRLESMAYGWLGEVLATPDPVPNFGYWEPGLRDAEGAVVVLEKSIALDPENLASHLQLCAVYESEKSTSKRNRLLDAMTARFPESKAVLVQAGRGCLDRKTYQKGIAYLRKALQLDRIDPEIPNLLVKGLLSLARQWYQKGRAHEGREAMLQGDEFLCGQPENFLRNSWCHLTRRGLLEFEFGHAAQGTALLDQARAASPSPVAFLWFAQIASRPSGRETARYHPRKRELEDFPKKDARIAQAATLVRIYAFWMKSREISSHPEKEPWLESYLSAAIRQPFTTREATELIETVLPHPQLYRPSVELVADMLKKDPHNPLLLCYKHLLQAHRHLNPDADDNHFKSVLEEAIKRGDQKAVNLARQILGSQRRQPPSRFPPEIELDEEPFDQLNEMVDWAALDPFNNSLPDLGLPPALAKILAGLPEKDLLRLRQERPDDMPEEFFDAVLNLARGKTPSMPTLAPPPKDPVNTPPKPRKSPQNSSPKTASDPRQLDLF